MPTKSPSRKKPPGSPSSPTPGKAKMWKSSRYRLQTDPMFAPNRYIGKTEPSSMWGKEGSWSTKRKVAPAAERRQGTGAAAPKTEQRQAVKPPKSNPAKTSPVGRTAAEARLTSARKKELPGSLGPARKRAK